jgi:hypothetical protein
MPVDVTEPQGPRHDTASHSLHAVFSHAGMDALLQLVRQYPDITAHYRRRLPEQCLSQIFNLLQASYRARLVLRAEAKWAGVDDAALPSVPIDDRTDLVDDRSSIEESTSSDVVGPARKALLEGNELAPP